MKQNMKINNLIPALALALSGSSVVLAGEQGSSGGGLGDAFGFGSGSLPGSGGVGGLSGPSGWEVTGAAGLSLAKGNADSVAYSVQALATYEGEVWEGLVGADYFYAENNDVTSADSLRIYGQGQRLLTDRLYLGLAGSYLNDEAADLDYRFDVAGVLGYHLIKTDRTKLSFEVGPGYAWEEQGGVANEFMTLRFGERFEHQLSQRSKLWQSAYITPQVDDFDNFNLIAEAGIDTLLSNRWSLRTSVRYLYDNTPAAGRQSEDVSLIMGLAYSLGGFPEPEEEGRATLKADRVEPEVAAMGWTTTASLGLSLAQGNSETLQASLGYDSAYRTATDEFFLNGLYSFGQNDGETSADALRLGTRYNRLLSERFFTGVGLDYLRDDVADLGYRVTAAAVAGYYVVKSDEMSLSFEAGPGYTWEESAGVEDSYLTLRGAQRFSWALGSRMTFKQDAIVDVDPGNFENYLLTVGAYLDTDITDSLSWRLAGTYIYDNEPTGDLEKSDTTLTSGIAVKF
jgi:putative salt-induced outer membrane protein YdiY